MCSRTHPASNSAHSMGPKVQEDALPVDSVFLLFLLSVRHSLHQVLQRPVLQLPTLFPLDPAYMYVRQAFLLDFDCCPAHSALSPSHFHVLILSPLSSRQIPSLFHVPVTLLRSHSMVRKHGSGDGTRRRRRKTAFRSAMIAFFAFLSHKIAPAKGMRVSDPEKKRQFPWKKI